MDLPPFTVTWDYLCPFARNMHEHLVTGLEAGAPWTVTFSPFSLVQSHVEEGEPPVWDREEKPKGVLALEASLVVRDRYPDRFLATHRALFAARHDHGRELADPAVVGDVLDACGVPADDVFAEVEGGWPVKVLRDAHEWSVTEHQVFGVPTFIVGDEAVFVRVMTRPGGDEALARSTIEGVVGIITARPDINELKHTTVSR